MEATFEHQSSHPAVTISSLPEERDRWPRTAGAAHEALLRELNLWSRDNDWPVTLNSWIAEEAVRQGY